jgi:Tol biopolymer transport system component
MSLRTLWVVMLSAVVAGVNGQPSSARHYNPRFSADGTSLIFESTRDGKLAVYTINVDGTKLRKLTDGKQNDAQPQWSGDVRFITFTSDAGGVPKVHIMSADGTGRRAINTGPKPDAAPSFAPDGSLVTWAATTELAEHWRDIGIVSADGSGARLITSGPGNDQAPIFIANTRIVFTRDVPPGTNWLKLTPEDHAKRRASSEVMAVDVDGTRLENLTHNDVLDANPSWASAIQRIFFTSSRGGSQELFSMTDAGADVRRVMDATGIQPSVSTDGRLVTYTRVVGDRSAVYIYDLASGREREVIGGDTQRHVN